MTKSPWKLKIEEIAKKDRMKKEEIEKLNEFTKTVKEFGVTAEKFVSFFDQSQEEKDNDEWLDLDINNIPSEVFTDANCDFKELQSNNEWVPWTIDLEYRYLLMKNFKKGCIKYRLKPLESIRIPWEINDILLKHIPSGHSGDYGTYGRVVTMWNNRKVEIIK